MVATGINGFKERDLDTVETEAEFSLDRSASHLLHRAQQFAAEKFEGMGAIDITLRQFAVLAAIQENEGCSQSDLVKSTGIDRSTLADMVQRMEKRGLIARAAAADDDGFQLAGRTGAGLAR